MKLRHLLLLSALAVPLGGCTNPANTSQPPAAIAPGYFNSADKQMGQILDGARAFYVSIQQQSAKGTLVLDTTTKKAFNTFGVTLNTADAVYLSYHNGTATQAQAQAQVDTVKSQQAALPLPGVK